MNIHADEWNRLEQYIFLEHPAQVNKFWNYQHSNTISKKTVLSRTARQVHQGGLSLPRGGIFLTATPRIMLVLLRMEKFMLIVASDWMSSCAHIRKKNVFF